MSNANCFICEADLYISDPKIFDAVLNNSCYFGKMVPGYSDDWVFDIKDGYISRIGKYGNDLYNMCGISYFKQVDSQHISNAVCKAYAKEGHEQLFWDEIVNNELNTLKLTVHPVEPEQIIEIDSVAELKAIDPVYAEVSM